MVIIDFREMVLPMSTHEYIPYSYSVKSFCTNIFIFSQEFDIRVTLAVRFCEIIELFLRMSGIDTLWQMVSDISLYSK